MTTEQVQEKEEARTQDVTIEEIKLTISYTPSRTVVGAQVTGCDPVLMVFSSPPPTFREALDQPLNEVVRRATKLAWSQRQYPAHTKPTPSAPVRAGAAPLDEKKLAGESAQKPPAAKVSKEGAQTGLFG